MVKSSSDRNHQILRSQAENFGALLGFRTVRILDILGSAVDEIRLWLLWIIQVAMVGGEHIEPQRLRSGTWCFNTERFNGHQKDS